MHKWRWHFIRYVAMSVVLLLFIWGLGPYLAIAGHTPFGSLLSRVITTLGLIVVGASSAWVLFLRDKRRQSTALLLRRTIEAMALVRKHFSRHPFQQKNQKWILLLGKRHAGKTALLTHSELE